MIARSGVEVELKFRLPDVRTGEDILGAASLGEFRPSGAIAMVRVEDRYLDTEGWALRHAGFAARLRSGPGGAILSLKSTARPLDGRVHHRRELEGPAGRGLDPATWAPSEARTLLLELTGDAPLVELATLRQLRRQRRFASDRADVELSVDEVQVVHGGRTIARFTELEGELMAGDARALTSLGVLLAGVPGIAEAATSKLEAALVAIGVRAPVVLADTDDGQGTDGPGTGVRPAGTPRAGDARPVPAAEPVPSAPAAPGAEPSPTSVGNEEARDRDGAPPGRRRPRHTVPTTIAVASPRTRSFPSATSAAVRTPTAPVHEAPRRSRVAPSAPAAVRPDPRPATPPPTRPTEAPSARRPGGQRRPGARPRSERRSGPGVDGGFPDSPAVPGAADAPAAPSDAPADPAPREKVAATPPPASPRRPKRPREPRTPGIHADDVVAEAGRKTVAFHLARMQAREPGTRAGDVEELHQMRVATRRMRAAWRVFGDGFDPRRTRRHRSRLRRVARMLGAVRDIDVLLEGLAAYRDPLPETERTGLEPLAAAWARDRERARKALLRELDGEPYRRWLDGYVAFAATPGAGARPHDATEPQRIRDTAAPRIWETFARVRAYEPVLRWADVATLHELRIAAKWLRYTLEFHEDVLGTDTKPLIAKVTALQDHLGLLHDADVAALLARTFLAERGTVLSEAERAATGRYLAGNEREIARLRRGVGSAWRGVAGLAFRRRLGRLVADL